MRPRHLLYLHGFNSSPRSYKAQAMQQAMLRHGLQQCLTIADIPPEPDRAAAYLLQQAQAIRKNAELCLCGSSLGGFYATWLAQQFGCRAVLINPAVRPHRLLKKYLGENVNYHSGEAWQFEQRHIDQLKTMFCLQITHPDRYWLLLQTGDEILDYRDAEGYYRGCPTLIEPGGSHAFEDFESRIDDILHFFGLLP